MSKTEQGSSPVSFSDILADATARVIVVQGPLPENLMPDGRPAPALMTVDEAAEYLRFQGTTKQKRQSIKTYVGFGKLAVTIVQSERRITLENCKDFIRRQTKPLSEYGMERAAPRPRRRPSSTSQQL